MATKKPFAGRGDQSAKGNDPFTLWKERRRRTGVDWREVSALSMRAAFHVATQNGLAVMISGASGGLGVCVTVWAGNERHKEYASNAEEVMGLLEGIIETYQNSAEDVRTALDVEERPTEGSAPR